MLWLSKGLGPGGAERLLVSLARTIDRSKFELHAAYLLPGKTQMADELRSAGVVTICLGGESPLDVRWVARLRQVVGSLRPDIVHSHSPHPASLARPALLALGPRRPALVYTEHNSWEGYRGATRAANAATWLLDDYRLAVSRTAFESVPEWMRGRTEVLVHGVDLREVSARSGSRARVRAELGVADGETLVVTVANLREHKDYPTLIEAARQVIASGTAVQFVAVGQGPLEPSIRAEINRLGLQRRFKLLGYRADSLDVIAAGDVFCLSSTAEGYPVALMEALALGRPVVATAVGGIPEAIRDGVEGILVPASSPMALADALVTIAADPARLRSMSSAAYKRASAFDIRRAAIRHEVVYGTFAAVRHRRAAARALSGSAPP